MWVSTNNSYFGGNMKAYIVTLYNSNNAGAFLQAWALGTVLNKKYNLDVSYIDTKARSLVKSGLKAIAGSIKHRDFKHALFEYRKMNAFIKQLQLLDICNVQSHYSENSILFFGSDEIWNIARKEVSEYPILWGSGITGGHYISYAPSANGAFMIDLPCANSFKTSLSRFEAISVRDESTANAVEQLIGIQPHVVCDPTLLLDKKYYKNLEVRMNQHHYVLVYSYGVNMTNNDIHEIRNFASRRRLRLISAGNWLPWCDESIPCAAGGFLGLIDNADYVITDTFHGTMLSAIYNKKFAVYARKNEKVLDALRMLDLEFINISKSNSLEGCMSKRICITQLESKIENIRNRSFRFLDSALGYYIAK